MHCCITQCVFKRLALSAPWQSACLPVEAGLWESAPLIQSPLDDKAALSYTQQKRRRERATKKTEREVAEKKMKLRWKHVKTDS